jgi:hypothetical protein
MAASSTSSGSRLARAWARPSTSRVRVGQFVTHPCLKLKPAAIHHKGGCRLSVDGAEASVASVGDKTGLGCADEAHAAVAMLMAASRTQSRCQRIRTCSRISGKARKDRRPLIGPRSRVNGVRRTSRRGVTVQRRCELERLVAARLVSRVSRDDAVMALLRATEVRCRARRLLHCPNLPVSGDEECPARDRPGRRQPSIGQLREEHRT